MLNIVHVTRLYSDEINNGRTLADIVRHMKSEVQELDEELEGANGPDGVVGECVDVILCALDAIMIHDPCLTTQDIGEIALKKLEKWKRRYSNSIDGDRTID